MIDFGWLTPGILASIINMVKKGDITRKTGIEMLNGYLSRNEEYRAK